MGVRDRIKRYRMSGAGADLVRVEVLVPADARAEILAAAVSIRKRHRDDKEKLQRCIDLAVERYGIRILDNIDLSRLPNLSDKARVVGKALMERGDARAFVLGRQLLAAA